MLFHNKDDIEFVTEFPCFWDTLYKLKLRCLGLRFFEYFVYAKFGDKTVGMIWDALY